MFETTGDKIFYGIGFLVAIVVFISPTTALPMLSYGRYKDGDVSALNIKILRACAFIMSISLFGEFLFFVFNRG